jgi:GNAT superfamily N-acetyltransferase
MTSFGRRPPVPDDAPAVAELVIAYERSLYGATEYSLGDLEAEWESLDLTRDALVLLDGERIVAFGELHDRGELWRVDGYVHPDEQGRGLGMELAAAFEATVATRGARRIQNAVTEPDLADHWEFRPRDFAEWREFHIETDRFDSSLWRIVRAGDEVAAGAICEAGRYGGGWVGVLFTRRPWRAQGVGRALLRDAFRKFQDRGEQSVGLSVDAENTTGAFQLYESVGMRPVMGWVLHEKGLA